MIDRIEWKLKKKHETIVKCLTNGVMENVKNLGFKGAYFKIESFFLLRITRLNPEKIRKSLYIFFL